MSIIYVSLSNKSLQGHYTKITESWKHGLKQWKKCDRSSQ